MSDQITYRLSYNQSNANFLEVEIELTENANSEIFFKIPYWRPGRYEAADYYRHVKGFIAYDDKGEVFSKRASTHSWMVRRNGPVKIKYHYYAQRMDAGGAWIDEDLFYINPVNCLMFVKDQEQLPCNLFLDLPESYQIATGLPKNGDSFLAENFDHLADSPILASADLQHHQFEIQGVTHNLWFNGRVRPDWKKLETDFIAYTKEQLKIFGDFPEEEFHYLYLISHKKAYHGVEHRNSTVIYLGPGEEIMTGRYENLLGVSSHELFHCWNVKNIRPASMLPYNFEGPNYSELGYVYEGFTTYYGDLMLSRANVFDKDEYFKEINTYLKRHASNYGRFNLSVSDSSFSTWTDGYQEVVPNRKTSIYVEGALNAMILDFELRAVGSSLDVLMKRMYDDFGKKKIGYTRESLIDLCIEFGFANAEAHFEKYYESALDLSSKLNTELKQVGCELVEVKNSSNTVSKYGFECDNDKKIKAIAPGSPAALAGLSLRDEIIAVDSWKCSSSNLSDLCSDEQLWITFFNKKGQLKKLQLKAIPKCFYYSRFEVQQLDKTEASQQLAFKSWCGKDF